MRQVPPWAEARKVKTTAVLRFILLVQMAMAIVRHEA